MLGYLKDGSDDEHLGEFAYLFFFLTRTRVNFSTHCSFVFIKKNIPWPKVLISRMVPCPSSALKLILVNNISLFVSPHDFSLLDGSFPRLTVTIQLEVFGDSGNRSPQFSIKK